jgi:hypothetical protein
MYLGSTTPDGQALKCESKGTTSKGTQTSYQGVVTQKDKDTITWQALHRTGGLVEGPSPVYELKRVPQAKKTK